MTGGGEVGTGIGGGSDPAQTEATPWDNRSGNRPEEPPAPTSPSPTDDEGAVLTLMGWCSGPTGATDQYHRLCRREYRTGFGVLTRCSCIRHQEDKEDNAAE